MPNEACRRVAGRPRYAAESLGFTREMLLAGNSGREKPSAGMEGVRKNSARSPGAEEQAVRDLITVLGIHRDFVALDRKGGEAGVGDEAVLHLFTAAGHAERGGVVARYADDGARLALARGGLC